MDFEEIFNSGSFYLLMAVGYGAFTIMLFVLKGMNQAELMPLWVKIVVLVFIPVAAALFSGYAEG